MAWELKIIHIDLLAQGDATLFVARERNASNAVTKTRSLLVDSGLKGRAVNVDAVIQVDESLDALDVIVATHYDKDHYGGITALMSMADDVYKKCRIYDQGEPSAVNYSRRNTNTGPQYTAKFGAREDDYSRYLTAIAGKGSRERLTAMVSSELPVEEDGPLEKAGFLDQDWLVGQELLWDGEDAVPAGAPTIECIAANQYVLQPDGGKVPHTTSVNLTEDRARNQKSIALLLTFGNFRYYVGGDIESTQESGEATLEHYLNRTDDAAGRIHAMKTSHHGSEKSSSAAFLKRVRARVAIISNGTNNQFRHPDAEVITRLEGEGSIEAYYLTGEQETRAFAGKAKVCGSWAVKAVGPPGAYGDVTIKLDAAEAAMSPPQFHVVYNRPDAGNNPFTGGTFAYAPFSSFSDDY